MKQASEKERRDALKAQSRREGQQPYATELDDRNHEQAKKEEKDKKTEGGPHGPPS
ncbi:hypothetical protein M2323_003224 [Rhodoblastus acidophilus]|uniref:hypothetical protein n=1 Tax=Rhodoblastus acidophilus TaxID=1074 RepID=UPI001612BA20|nr:hypothetical protein [Rhodoblastus acidophilus]MCW2285327.1 hypothetical protein [Rhodoblastus acidophilus]MCW2334283.1 hypothetical protein [Rhodoblastus acidophilus]